MKSRLSCLLSLLCITAILSACDVIEGPKVDPNGFTGSTNKVLIEDFTGHMCGNCPRAHEKATELKGTYGDNLIVVAVHCTNFSRVVPSIGYATDFNTDMGAELALHYDAQNEGLPIGLINRRNWNGSPITRYASWGTQVAAVLAEQPKIKLEVTPAYDPSDRSLTVSTHLEYFTTGDANHHVVAIITEDSIIAKQEDYSFGPDEDYVHNHVLRGSITDGTWGVPVKGNTIILGEKFDKTLTTTLDEDWVAEHCHVVVYVMDNSTKEILQVEEAKITE